MKNIVITDLLKNFNDGFKLNIEQITLENGKIYGLVGLNGAGKTTFMKALCGLIDIDSGEITLNDKGLVPKNILHTIGTNFIDMDGLTGMTLNEIYQENIFYYGLTSVPTLQTLLKKVNLNVPTDQKFNKMSLGMKQRFLLMLTFLHEPQLVLLDEPFNGLDPDGNRFFIDLITKYSANRIIIVSSHVLHDLESFIDSVIFIENGVSKNSQSMSDVLAKYIGGLNDYYDKQKNLFNFELEKSKKFFLRIIAITILSQLLTFLFFSLVEKLEVGENMLRDFHSIHALSSAVTMCSLAIVGAVFIRSIVVRPYLRNEQTRTFLYPIKRSTLFFSKLSTFSTILVISLLLGEVLSLVMEFLIGKAFSLSNMTLIQQFFPSIGVCILCSLLTLSIICIYCLIGIKLQSEVSTVVSAVIGIIIFSNVSVMGAINYLLISLVLACILFLGIFLATQSIGKWIDSLEVR